MKRLLFLLAAFSVLFAFSSYTLDSTQKAIVPQPIVVSMISLIATPEKFQGKVISVVGFLAIETEDARLFLNEEDYRQYIPENGVFIDVNKEVSRNMEKVDRHYVSLVGLFKQKGAGVSVGSNSEITDIRLCIPLLQFRDTRPRKLKDNSPENPAD